MIKSFFRIVSAAIFLYGGWTARGYWIMVETQYSQMQSVISTAQSFQEIFKHD